MNEGIREHFAHRTSPLIAYGNDRTEWCQLHIDDDCKYGRYEVTRRFIPCKHDSFVTHDIDDAIGAFIKHFNVILRHEQISCILPNFTYFNQGFHTCAKGKYHISQSCPDMTNHNPVSIFPDIDLPFKKMHKSLDKICDKCVPHDFKDTVKYYYELNKKIYKPKIVGHIVTTVNELK